MKHGYLIDMDGVLYRGHDLIPGADAFINELRQREIPFRLLTNNSQRARRDALRASNATGSWPQCRHFPAAIFLSPTRLS